MAVQIIANFAIATSLYVRTAKGLAPFTGLTAHFIAAAAKKQYQTCTTWLPMI
jgi:hypothetical protein